MSIEEFERLPDDGCRMELVRGRVVREPPAGFEHGRLDVEIGFLLRRWVEENPVGAICGAETGFILARDPPTVRAPDAAFVAAGRIPDSPVKGYFPGAPDLAVEIVSPSNTPAEIRAKVRDYLDAGTRLVWVFHPDRRAVDVHEPASEPRRLTGTDELDGGEVLPGFRTTVQALFGA